MADKINPSGTNGLGINFLPNFFKTDANKRFLQATVDQLVQPGTVKKVNGYIGREYAKATTAADIFVEAADADRQNYQLEPSFVIQDTLGNYTFFKDYIDYIHQLGVFGANVKNHERLNKQEFYSWNPHIDWDKFVNFQNYYWLSYGPATIKIYGQQLNVESTYTVAVQDVLGNNQYVLTPDGATPNPVIKLYRGQTYHFEVNSPSNPFSIKTARSIGVDDRFTSGVTNNGVENGTLTFVVPLDAPTVLYYQSEFDAGLGGVFEVYSLSENTFINVEEEILGKKTYTLSDGTALSNGMKVSFGGEVSPANYKSKEFYVEGVGVAINLIDKRVLEVTTPYSSAVVVPFDSEPFDSDAFGDTTGFAKTLDYIVINRASVDHNGWSRYNRWFHKDVIEASAKYNGGQAQLDQTLRAVRPIIEFEANLKLHNFGTTAIDDIDLVDTFTTDAFSTVEGTLGYNIDGVPLAEGQKIIFLADTDRLVKNNIYQVKFIDVQHTGSSRQISLVKVSEPSVNNVALVKQGLVNAGLMYWFDGTTWRAGQQKTNVNQAPLFDVIDEDGYSYSDTSIYEGSTFAGTKVFSYRENSSGVVDNNLGFALSYKNINNIGDILFDFNLSTDTFDYKEVLTLVTKNIATGYLVKTDFAGNYVYMNGWETSTAPGVQAAVRIYKNSNKVNNFDLDIFDSKIIPDLILKVYVNGIRLSNDKWTVVTGNRFKRIVLDTDITTSDVLTIKAYTLEPINDKGFYEIPVNLQNNPMNDSLVEFTLGEVIDHVGSIVENVTAFAGTYPGAGNLRDLGYVTPYGTKFVQHSGPASLSLYHITSQTNNIVRAVEQSRDIYNQFKKNFVSTAENLGVDGNPVHQVNLVLAEINKDKPSSFPYYFSDMVPYRASNVSTITVIDGRIQSYPLKNIFSLDSLSSKAVGVYVNDEQLLHGSQYTFDSQGFVFITATLQEGDIITIYEYDSTDGSFIPETPTKLGLWPKYEPKIYKDTTVNIPNGGRWMIQGHDGSQVLAYGDYDVNGTPDYRDAIILELEKRIFNNIKIQYDTSIFDIADVLPSYNTQQDYTIDEFDQVLAPNFYKWTSLVDRDFSKPMSYDRNDPFTYNYTEFTAPDGRIVPGYWRGIYLWMLGTDRPHTHPWEMLGFSIEPAWWTDLYGVAPYTSDNTIMWQDIADGIIREPGVPAAVNKKYVRPYIMKYLPVDSSGNLASPSHSGLAYGIFTNSTSQDYIFGDVSPVEAAWRRSSHYSFSVILTSLLLTPSKTFGILLDRSRIVRNLTGQLVYKDTGLRIKPSDVVIPSIYSSTDRVQTSGIINYIANYILSDNLKSYDDYAYDLNSMSAKISYRVGAFTSKEKFNLLLDSKSPLSTGSVFVPQENYVTILNKSSPVRKITYSGVVITKLSEGYEVKGYSKTQPYFKYYNYLQSGVTINVGGISEAFVNWASNQMYTVGKVVKFSNRYFRVTVKHTSDTTFNPANFQVLSSLPVIGGKSATLRRLWDRNSPITVPYGTMFRTIQEVVDFLLGYGEWLKDEGFIFDEFNTTLNAVTNWETSAKEFLFWTTQNWSTGQDKWNEWQPNQVIEFDSVVRYNGDYWRAIRTISPSSYFDDNDYIKLDGLSTIGSSVISLSPAADKITFNTGLSVVDDIRNSFNGYEIYKVDGTPLESIFINSYREDNAVSYSPRTADGIYGATFYLVQHEHVVVLDNTTMFNDTIYSPPSGYKQDRIKISSYVSSNWYGGFNIPGFILDVAEIQDWTAWEDYDLGDIVKYKQFFYTASKFLAGAETFNDSDWIRLESKPTTQLLPNFNYKASQFEDFYSLDSDNFDQGQQKMAQHLIGYQKRQYLENIIQDDVSEFKFYQGMIREKGTQNSLNKLFDVLGADNEDSLKFYEEWAIRVGQYGASDAFENVEFILDEALFRNNPQGFELTDAVGETYSNFVIRQNRNQLYLKPIGYDNNPWPKLETYKPYFRSAGYVRADEVFLSLSSMDELLTKDITTFVNGCYIWVAFEGHSWNVYRYTDFNVNVTNVEYSNATKTLTITAQDLIKFKVGSYVGLAQVGLIAGFYKITSTSLNTFTVSANITGWKSPFTQADNLVVYGFLSQRVSTINDIDSMLTANLKKGEQIWTDNDGTDKWATWTYNQVYAKTPIINNDPADALMFGRSVLLNKQGNIAIITDKTGEVHVYDTPGLNSSWILRQTIQRPYVTTPSLNQSYNFASTVAISPDSRWLAVGAPSISYARSYYAGEFSLSETYSIDNIVNYNGLPYQAVSAVPTGTVPTNTTYWQLINYIPVNLNGTVGSLEEHGVISIYEKDNNNIFSLVDTILSPNPLDKDHFGSTLAFGSDVLYVAAAGDYSSLSRTSSVYKLNYSTKNYHETPYNPVGSSGTIVAVTSTSNIEIGMFVSGDGFTSGQVVTGIIDSKRVRLNLEPDSEPSGIITFSLKNWRYDSTEVYTATEPNDNFGINIAVSSDNTVLAIAASNGPSLGTVNVYVNPGASSQDSILEGLTTNFGKSITISDDGLYLGVSDDIESTSTTYHQGTVRIYSRNGSTYTEKQVLSNYLPEESGYFGSKIAFMNNYKTLVVFSANEDTFLTTLFDNGVTTFDKDSTQFKTVFVDSGRVDVYDLYANTWVYSETLTTTSEAGDGYGTGFAVGNNKILVSSPYALNSDLVSGIVYDYTKSANNYSWKVKHSQVDIPDVNKIKTAFLYNKSTGELVKYLDIIDPAQGRIAGPADEEIRYKTFYDPAIYSVGVDGTNVDSSAPWGKSQVGKLWWDLRTAKFVNSYDDDVLYRTSTWNTLATGASIDIYEWVETTLLPEAWNKVADTEAGLASGISGISLYGNTVYSLRQKYDTISQTTSNIYYYWVKNKKTIPNIKGRYLSAQSVSSLISNPRGQAYSYLALTGVNSFSLVNAKQYLEDTNVVLSVEYWLIDKRDQNIHSQWKIINEQSSTVLPRTIEDKWIDSLCGKDLNDRPVPDMTLPPKLRYGIENRPRQGMFINRFEALKQLVEQANIVMTSQAIAKNKDVSQLELYDVAPSLVTGLYDSTQNTVEELRFVNIGAYKRPTLAAPTIVDGKIIDVAISYAGRGYLVAPYITFVGSGVGASARAIINAAGQITGVTMISQGEGYADNTVAIVRDYAVLVFSDSSAQGNWSIHSYDPVGKVWSRIQSQKYDVRNYRTYIDWYSTGYNQFTAIDHSVDTLADLQGLAAAVGQLVKVRTVGTGGWYLLEKYADVNTLDYTQNYKVVGIESGTAKFNSSLYQAVGTDTGYDGSTYDGVVYDNSPVTELRIILNALKNDIFVDDLKSSYLNLFLTTIRYALSEQVYLDWIFKTSFVKSIHNVGGLLQHTTYRSDNLPNFQDYIDEVKPYKSKVREYISSYQSLDTSQMAVTDFDLPPVYNATGTESVRTYVKDGNIQADHAAVQSYPWKSWLDNVGYQITELKIIDGGSDYITEPVVRITSASGSGATARAFFANGKINRVVLLTPGAGYLEAPTVVLDGGLNVGGTAAKVVAIIGKGVTRSNLVKIKFDRVMNSYYITQLTETEAFSATTSKLKYALKWAPDTRIGQCTVTIDGVPLLRDNYSLSIVKSTSKGFTTYSGMLTLESGTYTAGSLVIEYRKDSSLLNASDRIQYFYDPQAGNIGKDLAQLMNGVDYGGVIISGMGFEESTGWGVLPYFTDKWDGFDSTFDDYIKVVAADTHEFTLPYVPALNEKINVYYVPYSYVEYVSDGVTTQYPYNIYVSSPIFGAYKDVVSGGVETDYVYDEAITDKTVLKLQSTTGIVPGMSVTGHGFSSGQKVVSVDSAELVTISAEWNVLPSGTLAFTKNVPGSYTLEVESTYGVKVGDRIATTSVSAFNYDTVVTSIDSITELTISQIILTQIPVGSAIRFSRALITPIDLLPAASGNITLTDPLETGTVFTITGSLSPVRIDDPDYAGVPMLDKPSVVMETIIGDGATDTFSIPLTFPVYDNDKFILRKWTSDGSIKPTDSDYDTALSGGAFEGNYASGSFTSATGYAADDIILDGDGLVTPTSSPATEEVVPGQVVDAVAIKVYDQPYSGAANIKIDNFMADGVQTDFVLSQQPNSPTAIIIKLTTGTGPGSASTTIASLTDDYTFDYATRTVKFNSAPAADTLVNIYSIGFNGSKILDLDYFVGDGTTTEFITKAKWLADFNSLVYVNGVAVTPDAFRTDTTYDSANRIAFRFGIAPAAGEIINFIVVAGLEKTYAVTKTERLLTDGSLTYALTYSVGEYLPNESNMIVRANDSIVAGPINSYFKIENNKLNYKLDATKVLPYSTSISNISVYVGKVKLSQGPDYTVDASGITIKLNKISYATYAKKTLVVSVSTGQGYTYDPTTNEITFVQTFGPTDVVEVVSSYKHDILDIQRTEVTVSTDLSFTQDTVEYYSYRSLINGRIPLDRAVIDDSYVWVVFNERLLAPSIEYKLLADKSSIQLAFTPEETDKVTLITFSSNVMVPNISYMQFKDMLNRVHFKRLSANKRTKLIADLKYNDVNVYVEDASTFDVPNVQLNKPGIVEIYGERIEYFSIADTGSGWALGRLRRGTLGTGTPAIHKTGTFVQDIGYSETIPYAEQSIIEQIISDGTNIVPLKFTPMKDVVASGHDYVNTTDWQYQTGFVSSIPAGYIQADDIEVFVGGYGTSGEWTANTKYHVGDIVAVGSYTYRTALDHISGSSFTSNVTTVVYNSDGSIASTVATDVAPDWTFFVGNIRLKKYPYQVHNVNQAEYSPEGDIQLDAEFAVDGVSNQLFLTNKLSLGTQVTVIKRVGFDWDSTVNVMYDTSKIGQFLKATPGIWYEESNPNRT